MRRNEVIPLPTLEDEASARPEMAVLIPPPDGDEPVEDLAVSAPARPINYRFLIAFAASFGLVFVTVPLLHNWQIRSIANVYFERAEQSQEQGDLERATASLQRYIALAEDDDRVHEARRILGQFIDEAAEAMDDPYAKFKKQLQAFQVFKAVLRYDPENAEVRRQVIDFLTSIRRYRDARIHLEKLQRFLEQQGSQIDGHVFAQLADCYEAEGDYLKAAQAYEDAIRAEPREFEYYERRANILRHRFDQPAQADAILNKMVEFNRTSPRAYLIRARYRQSNGMQQEAVIDAKQAYRLEFGAPGHNGDPEILILAANVITSQSGWLAVNSHFDVQEVQANLQQAYDKDSDNVELNVAATQMDVLEGRTDLAEKRLREGLADDPQNIELLWVLADVLTMRGKIGEAKTEVENLRRLKAPDALIRFLEGRIAMAQGNFLEAADHLREVNTVSLGKPRVTNLVNIYLGRCYEKIGHEERRLAAYTQAVESNRTSAEGRIGLAETLARAGRVEEALVHYRLVMDFPGVPVQVARLLIARNLQLPHAQRDWREVEEVLDAAARTPSQVVNVILLRTRLLIAQDRLDDADTVIDRAIQRNPEEVRLWATKGELLLRQDKFEQAIGVLDDAKDKLGRLAALSVARARFWSTRDPAEARVVLSQLEQGSESFAADHQTLLTRNLAVAYEAIGDNAAAMRLWRGIAADDANDLAVWRRLLDLALRDGDDNQAQEFLDEIKRIDADGNTYGRLGESERLLQLARNGDTSGLGRARNILNELSQEMPSSPRVSRLLAEIAEIDNAPDTAIEFYRDAIERGEQSPQVYRRLVQLLNHRRRYFEAEQVFEQFRESHPLIPADLGRLGTAIYLQTSQHDRALKLAREAVLSNDFRDHLWLSRILWATGQLEEAKTSFQQALELQPAEPACWVSLVNFLARTGHPQEAQEKVEEAATSLPVELRSVTLAQCHEVMGRLDRAEEQYRSALNADPDNGSLMWVCAEFYLRRGRTAESEPLLRKLISPEFEVASALAGAARRAQAAILASGRGHQGRQDALQLLDANINQLGSMPQDLRIQARLLARSPSRSNRQEAIDILTGLAERVTLTAADQFELARLYLSVDDWPSARQTMQILLAGFDNNPDYLAYCIRNMLRNDDNSTTASKWLQALVGLEPEALRTVELQARVLIAQGEHQRALALLQEFLASADTDSSPDGIRAVAVVMSNLAETLDRSGRSVAADRFYRETDIAFRRYAEIETEGVLALAQFLGRRWGLKEAFALLDQAWDIAKPEKVAVSCITLLRTRQATSEQFAQIRRRMEAAAKTGTHSAEMSFQLANLAHLEGDYERAEQFYRETVERAPDSVPALNELALLIALRGGETSEALKFINRAIELAGPLPYLHDTRATIILADSQSAHPSEQLESAIRDLKTAIGDAPTAVRYFHLAQIYFVQNQREMAQSELLKGIEAGLQENVIHPLERQAYLELREDLL